MFWETVDLGYEFLLWGSGNKLSRFMPLSKIKTCFDIVREWKFGKIELILDIIVSLSSKIVEDVCCPQINWSLFDRLIAKLWLFK